MKTTSKKIASGALAALCLTLGSGLKAADPTYDIKLRSEHEIKDQTKTADRAPAKFNKASGIVGMTVRNQMDERLGTIKDVVFDLKSERVAYAVISTGLLRQKNLAVPLSAFTASADNKYLILCAEKSKFLQEEWLNAPRVGTVPQGAARMVHPRRAVATTKSTEYIGQDETSDGMLGK